MKLGVCTISAKSHDLSSIVAVCRDLHVDGLEVWGKDHVGDGSRERCREIRRLAASHDLELPVYGSYLRPGADGFDEHVDHELAIASHLDVDVIRVWAGEQEFQVCDEDHWDAVVDDLRSLATAAASAGLEVTIERHEGTVTNKREGARSLIEAIDDTSVGLNYQPLFEDGPDEILEDVAALADLTNNVHLQAVRRPNERERCPLEAAYFDVAAVVDTLQSAGYGGYFEIEFVDQSVPYREALAADVAYLRAAG